MYLGNRVVYLLTAKDGEHMIEPKGSISKGNWAANRLWD